MCDAEFEQLLIAREKERRDALVSSDMAALADLMTDDLVHVHATGMVHAKQDLLGHAGLFLQFHEVERGPLTIRRLALDVAVMTGAMTNRVSRRGEEEIVVVKAFVTQVWLLQGDRWRVASFHAVRTPETL